MQYFRRYWLLIPLLLAILACRLQTGEKVTPANQEPVLTATHTVSPSATPISESPTYTATVSPTPTGTPTQVPTPTAPQTQTPLPSPTQTFIPSTPTPTSIPKELQLEVFEDLWKIVNEDYLYADFNGLDWNTVHDEVRLRIEEGLTNTDFYTTMAEMIYRLGDDHSQFLTPEEIAEINAEYEGNLDYVGIGVLLAAVPERQRAVIHVVFPGSPAEEAGMLSHDSILSVDGQPILDPEGYINPILRGPEGTTVRVEVQSPGGDTRFVQITRRQITGSVPVPSSVLITPNGKRIGYILVPTFIDGTVDDQVGEALEALSLDVSLDGIILDNRINEGGYKDVFMGTLRYFLSGNVGTFVNRQDETTLNLGKGKDTHGSQTLPMVVMVGPQTVSFGEISSGIFQDTARAYIIGEVTDGNVELLMTYDLPDGSHAWIAHDTFRPINHPEANWEDTGIIPDLSITAPWDLYTLDTDPAVQAALAYLDTR